MERAEDFLQKLKQEKNLTVLCEEFHLEDNFSILLTVNNLQKEKLEEMLETYPRVEEYFKKNYETFGIKYYSVKNSVVGYNDSECLGIIDWFKNASGENSNSNSAISFHPNADGSGLTTQLIYGKESVLEIAKKLIKLKIPFETVRPPSRYTPH